MFGLALTVAFGFGGASVGLAQNQGAPPQAQAVAKAEPEPELPVNTFTLRNGLTVVVLEQPGVTSFTATFLHQAGVAREWQGLRGAAQLVGTSLLDGTSRVGSKNWRQEQQALRELDRLDRQLAQVRAERARAGSVLQLALDARVEQLSAQFEAAKTKHEALVDKGAWQAAYAKLGAEGPEVEVGHDGVAYSVTLPVTALQPFFALEQSRASDPVARSFYSARAELHDGFVQAQTGEGAYPILSALSSTAYVSHPYGRYKASPEQLMGVDRAELQFFLKAFTAPSRTVLAVVGGVQASQVKRLAERTLGRVVGGNPAAELEGLEPTQTGSKKVFVEGADSAEFLAAFHAGSVNDPADSAAMSVLIELMGDPNRGLLKAVQQRHGQDAPVSAGLFPAGGPLGPRDPPVVVLGMASPAPGVACAMEADLWLALAVVATSGPPEAELKAAKARASARVGALWADHALMAPALAWTKLTTGDARALLAHYDAISGVGPADIRELATKVFNPDGRTVVVGWPSSAGDYNASCVNSGAAAARQ